MLVTHITLVTLSQYALLLEEAKKRRMHTVA